MEESQRILMPDWCQSFKRPPCSFWHCSVSIWYQIFSQKMKKCLGEETQISILTKIASWFFAKKCYFNGEKSKNTDARMVPKLLEHLHAPFGTALDPFDSQNVEEMTRGRNWNLDFDKKCALIFRKKVLF